VSAAQRAARSVGQRVYQLVRKLELTWVEKLVLKMAAAMVAMLGTHWAE
jgi:hypothetical protein